MTSKVMYGSVAVLLCSAFLLYIAMSGSVGFRVDRSVDGLLAKLSKEQLLAASDAVVMATVQDARSVKAPSEIWDGKEDIFTHVTLSVEEYLYNPKDLSTKSITMRVLGGEIGDERMRVEHGSDYEKNVRIIVFLTERDDGTFANVAPQGTYTVTEDGLVGVGDEKTFIRDIYGQEQLTIEELRQQLSSVE